MAEEKKEPISKKDTMIGCVFLIVIVIILGFLLNYFVMSDSPKDPTPSNSTPSSSIDDSKNNSKIAMINPSQYADNTPEKALAEYMTAWKNKDWNSMVTYSQKTWQSTESTPSELLKAWYDFTTLQGVEIASITPVNNELLRNSAVDIEGKISYSVDGQIHNKQFTARIVCESAPNNPNPNGTWGVNPASTLNIFK